MAAHWAAESLMEGQSQLAVRFEFKDSRLPPGLMEGQSQLAVRFEFKDSRLPPGAIERCVGNFGVVWATLESQV